MELINKYTTELQIMPSQVDYENRLRYHETFNVFMDLANRHAEILGIDQNTLMNKGLADGKDKDLFPQTPEDERPHPGPDLARQAVIRQKRQMLQNP